ncbi:MAG: DMT family transporter [Pseudomonadota bacterium]
MLVFTRDARLIGFLFLSVTVCGWALNWPAIKFLLREWPPLFSRGVAGVAAALILAAIALSRRESLHVPRRDWLRLAFAAFTNVFAWMGFGTMVMQHLSISEGSLLAYTMPIWTMLFAWPVLGQRPSLRGVAAVILGSAGILVLFSGQLTAGTGFALGPDKTLGVVLALAAAIFFALGSVLNAPLPLKPIPLAAWQVGLGCLPMIALGLAFEHPDFGALTASGWSVLIYMIVGPMGLCYLTWFAALERLPPTTATMGTLGVPVIGVIAGAVTLGEPLGLREVAAAGLTLAGVALALRRTPPPPIE